MLLDAAIANLLSPAILCFGLGLLAGAVRSDLDFPDAIAKGLSIYLIFAIGFKGGVVLNEEGIGFSVLATLLLAGVLSFIIPIWAFAVLRATSRIPSLDAAAVSAHYGSVSIVTFVAATDFLRSSGVTYEGQMTAVVAVMETPAIITGLLLASRGADSDSRFSPELLREVLVNGSVVLLIGGFAIGLIVGAEGFAKVSGFLETPFQGLLALFLLEMGLVVARRLRETKVLDGGLVAFALYMPPINALVGLAAAWLLGLSPGGGTLLMVLCASASYIAVPAAMRLAVPRANPSLSLTASLALTFPFNVTIGIPLYYLLAETVLGAV